MPFESLSLRKMESFLVAFLLTDSDLTELETTRFDSSPVWFEVIVMFVSVVCIFRAPDKGLSAVVSGLATLSFTSSSWAGLLVWATFLLSSTYYSFMGNSYFVSTSLFAAGSSAFSWFGYWTDYGAAGTLAGSLFSGFSTLWLLGTFLTYGASLGTVLCSFKMDTSSGRLLKEASTFSPPLSPQFTP